MAKIEFGTIFKKVTDLSVKAKLMVSYLALALLVGLVGGFGWYYIGSIESTMREITNKAAPAVKLANALKMNLWEANRIAEEILGQKNDEAIEPLDKEFKALDGEFKKMIAELSGTVTDKALIDKINATDKQHRDVVDQTSQMVQIHRTRLEKERQSVAMLTEFDKAGDELIKTLGNYIKDNKSEVLRIGFSGEGIKAELEKKFKESPVVTVDGYLPNANDLKKASLASLDEMNKNIGILAETSLPKVEAASQLQFLVAEMKNVIASYLAEKDPEKLRPIEVNLRRQFAKSRQFVASLKRIAKTPEARKSVEELEKKLTAWLDAASADGKLLDTYKEQLTAVYEADEITAKMEVDAAQARKSLDAVTAAANELNAAADEKAAAVVKLAKSIILFAVIIGFGVSVILGFILTNLITGPVKKAVAFAETMASGDFSQSLEVKSNDEIGVLTRSLNDMTGSLGSMFKDIANSVDTLSAASTELSAISQEMSAGALQTTDKASLVAAATEEMSSNMNTIAAAMEEASASVDTVASASEEMTATVSEIASNTEKAARITADAVTEAKKASQQVDVLGKAAQEVGVVTQTITDISEQTKLLALNATIEAARAGEAGKGFAVVAGEIKELANGTAAATEEVKQQISGIQSSAEATMSMIEQISKVIYEVNEIVSVIAASVEQQSATTKEIAQNMAQTSTGINEVTRNVSESNTVAGAIARDISSVNAAAEEMSASSDQVSKSSLDLSTLAEQLKEMVSRFKV